ncbi:MAG: MBOAT family protein [Erysipelotrichaceae bacterium]|jgi:alginate O-acetyltransferase complex protein AlgI|nr:MBOAT family protein [Erysipelotrichaceae bacterium]
MAFTSLTYIVFFTFACFVYFLLSSKLKIYWLLLCSYYFYMSWNVKYAFLMLFSTIITYLSGILIERAATKRQRRIYVCLSFMLNLGILFLFKYYTFLIDSLTPILQRICSLSIPSTLHLLLPIGISFYTFQALSYTVDVYRNDVNVERNFFRYALFVSFFPQLVAGPIERSKTLLGQFSKEHKFQWKHVHEGLFLIVIGFFYKLVIADRAAIGVNQVYNHLDDYAAGGGLYLIAATMLFAVQIYFDFRAYSAIACGSANVMGYQLSRNFNMPYFADSIKDFWRRWHISLSTWFKEYVYVPLGGNRKGFFRTQLHIMIVFLASGLWHGAAWNFVIWGGLHGLYQVVENVIRRIRPKQREVSTARRLAKILWTFVLIDFAWIFFRANTLSDSFFIIRNLFCFGMTGDLSMLGFQTIEALVLLISLTAVFLLDIASLNWNLKRIFYGQHLIIRWFIYYFILFFIIIFGMYGPGFDAQEFIYFQF